MDGLDLQRILQPDLKRLEPLRLADALEAWLAEGAEGAASQSEARTALKALADRAISDAEFQDALNDARFSREGRNVRLVSLSGSRDRKSGKERIVSARLALAARALGLEGAPEDLTAAALIRLYGVPLDPLASIAEVRCALLFALMQAILPGQLSVPAATPKRFQMDAVSRALYLAFAGLAKGTVAQAERAMLRRAFDVRGRTFDLAAVLVSAALAPRPVEEAEADRAEAGTGAEAEIIAPVPAGNGIASEADAALESFAAEIRRIASTMETKPYQGRVAIASVYDAALQRGLRLGSLDDFKARVAEAARESLIDLERHDIAGPIDSNLLERSRTRLGRDERHFIVNRW